MKIILIISLFFNSLTASAMEVWVTTPEPVSKEKMQSLIKALPPELKDTEVYSLTEEEMRHSLSTAAKERVEKILAQAQEEELQRNYGLAIKFNEQALLELEKHPNVLGLQNITHSVFLKIAELYDVIQDKEKSQSFWQKAFAWNSKAELHEEVFPKSVIKKYKALKPHSETTQVKIKAPLHSLIFFNGKKVTSNSVNVLTGKHQIAVLVPGSLWQVENLRIKTASKKPLVFNFKARSVVSGSCETPMLQTLNLPPQTRLLAVFEKENCSRVFDGDTWYSMDGQQVYKQGTPTGKMIAQMKGPGESWLSKASKSPWFWAGVGVVLVGSVIVIRNQQQPNVVPIETHSMQ